MALFLITVLGVYAAVHVYTFLKVRAAFAPGGPVSIVLGICLAFLTLAPLLVRVLEQGGYDRMARMLAGIGYTWMGLIFLFFCICLGLELFRMGYSAAGALFSRDLAPGWPGPRTALLLPLGLSLGLCLYGYVEARQIISEHLTLVSEKIPASVGRLRIVQISDVHLGLLVREGRLRRIVEAIQAAGPDLLVSTGDLVDGQIDHLDELARIFEEIQPPCGKYAVTGNHEFYAGLPSALAITSQTGFIVLRGRAVTLAGGILTLAGVDDPTAAAFGLSTGTPEGELLAGLPQGTFTVLLKHQPRLREASLGDFDLQLSGHTHAGQIFPFGLVTRLFFARHAGFYELPAGSRLYVSRGSGTWGPPLRLLAPPEITVIDLVPPGSRTPRQPSGV